MTAPTPPAGPPNGDPGGQNPPGPGQSGSEGGQNPSGGGPGPANPQNGSQGGNGQPDQRPPWEREGVAFDPARAWELVQNLRGERDGLKTERDTLSGKVTEAERAKMSDLEKAQTTASEEKARADENAAKLARYEVAAEKGVPANAVPYLQGNTKAELAASADGLLAVLAPGGGSGGQAPPSGGRPTERLSPPPPGGQDPNAPAVEMDPAKLAGAVPRGF